MPFKKAKKGADGTTVVYSGDSSVLVKKDGTLAWRNNNPGNIKCDSVNFAKRHGAIGCEGKFAIFPDRQTGEKAQESLLRGRNYQNSSIAEAIKTYAPRKDNNDTEKYIQYVTKKSGMSRDKKLREMNPKEFDKFAGSIRSYERTTPGTEVTLPNPDKIKNLLRSPRGSSQGSSSERSIKRVGDTVYRIEKGRVIGSFTCNRGKNK